MANDIMIDIESLNTTPDCVILSIGAVRFDPKGNGIVERLFRVPDPAAIGVRGGVAQGAEVG